jgi:hypothetical protein
METNLSSIIDLATGMSATTDIARCGPLFFKRTSLGPAWRQMAVGLHRAASIPASGGVTMNTWKYFVPVALLAAAMLLTSGAPLYPVALGIVLAALVIWVSNRGTSNAAR